MTYSCRKDNSGPDTPGLGELAIFVDEHAARSESSKVRVAALVDRANKGRRLANKTNSCLSYL